MIETTLSFFAILIIVVLSVTLCAGASIVVRSVYDDWDEWINDKSLRDEAAAHQDALRGALFADKFDCSYWPEAELIKLAAAIIALVQERDAALTPGCFWEQDGEMWASSCGASYQFTDGGPADNDHKYCHLCGCPIQIAVDVIAQDEPA